MNAHVCPHCKKPLVLYFMNLEEAIYICKTPQVIYEPV